MDNIPRTCHRQLLANAWEQKSEVTHYPVSLFAFYIPKYARKVAIGKFSMSIYLIIFYNTTTVNHLCQHIFQSMITFFYCYSSFFSLICTSHSCSFLAASGFCFSRRFSSLSRLFFKCSTISG